MRLASYLSVVALLGGSSLAGCGGDTDTGGGGSNVGGSNAGGSNTGGTNTGGTNTGGTNTGGTNTGGASVGGGGSGGCVEITDVTDFFFDGNSLRGTAMPNLGGVDPDFVTLLPALESAGSGAFTAPALGTDCGKTANCSILFEDNTQTAVAALYVASNGTLSLTSYTRPYYATGAMTGVTYVEITYDETTDEVTPVPGGKCAHLASFEFDLQPPVAGWTCDPRYYDETGAGLEEVYCDCECGAYDPDCDDVSLDPLGCLPGQTCGLDAHCAGVPDGWTCADDQYDGGAGNGCDCSCGIHDPDCDLVGEPVDNCTAGESCTVNGICFDDALWTCGDQYYGAADGCDCGCGIVDPDCPDATKASCKFCNDDGSCDTVLCDDAASKINADNNAVCDP